MTKIKEIQWVLKCHTWFNWYEELKTKDEFVLSGDEDE